MIHPEIDLIGICGGSCSGKTTLVENLKDKLGNQLTILSFDDYFVGLEALRDTEVTDWENPNLYHFPEFTRDLRMLKDGHPIKIKSNSRESIEKGVLHQIIYPSELIIIEGFLIWHEPETRILFDHKVFIDLEEEEILKRRLARINSNAGWDSLEYIQNQLLNGHRKYVLPQKRFADLVIDGSQPIEPLARTLINYLGDLALLPMP